jgi:hypothetical protein
MIDLETIQRGIQFVNVLVEGFRPPGPEAPEIWELGQDFTPIRRIH